MKGAATCAACHPKPFAMKVSGGRAGGGWHESGACGSCHAAGRAFDVADAASCERCHAASESKP
jgi:c(7)-type cytochrome triheme protein